MNNLRTIFKSYLPLNRKERFYTGTVLPQIICHDNFKHLNLFFNLINNFPKDIELSIDPNNTNIQFMTEFSLKESIVKTSGNVEFKEIPESKDTPDLVILITSPKKYLIIAEAKMFTSSNATELESQMDNQLKIIRSIKETLDLAEENIFHIGIVPEKLISREAFNKYQLIYWEDILSAYKHLLSNEYFYNVLNIAISEFDNLTSQNKGVDSFRKNMDTMVSGFQIIELHNKGERFYVGRNYGLSGHLLQGDKESGEWKSRKYEVNFSSGQKPNHNWFTSEEFANFMYANTNIFDNNKNKNILKSIETLENSSIAKSDSEKLGDWHFSHLGYDYFENIASLVYHKRTLDVPIKILFLGKKGVPYIRGRFGNNVNPNWAVITEDNRQIKCKSATNLPERGLWDIRNCHRFEWQDIKSYYENRLKIIDT